MENLNNTPARSVMDLVGKNIVVYDLEIKNEIDGKEIGWKDFHKMGISVGCAFDYRSYSFHIYMDDNINKLVARLNEPKTLIVAFNQTAFDNNLLRKDLLVAENPLKDDCNLNNYDMYLESNKGSGASQFSKGKTLDDHLYHMKIPMKTEHGSMAPIMWKEEKIGAVVDYCLQDVSREKMLFERAWMMGKMANSFSGGEYFGVRLPVLDL